MPRPLAPRLQPVRAWLLAWVMLAWRGNAMAGERQTTIDLLPTATQPASDSAGTDLDTYWLTAPYPAERNSLRVPILETLASFTVILGGTMVDPEFSNTEPPSMRNFVNAFTLAPDWSDGDGHLINWVLHPEMGAEMYLLARNRDYPAWAAFAFSTVGSFAWEFLFEGWVEQPSGIDLALTSTAGAVLGEVRYQVREYLLTQPRSTWRDVGIVLADGIEAFHRAVAPPSPGLAPLAFDAPRTGPATPEAATGLALTLRF